MCDTKSMRSLQDIMHMANAACEAADNVTEKPGASYEQGIAEALLWVLGEDMELF